MKFLWGVLFFFLSEMVLAKTSFFQGLPFEPLDWGKVSSQVVLKEGAYWLETQDYKIRLTLIPTLQMETEKNLVGKYMTGSSVLIEPSSGRILAMAETRGTFLNPLMDNHWIATSATAPTASLMKIVTAVAALEANPELEPETEISFYGGCSNLFNKNWLRSQKYDRQKMTLAKAFGVSCNTVFARLSNYEAGLDKIIEYADKFYFNKMIPSDLILEKSEIHFPSLENATSFDVGQIGAGFGLSHMSPVHAAMLSAAMGNEGKLMAPQIIDVVFDFEGREIYKSSPKVLGQVASLSTIDKMSYLMTSTITSGTSRRAFTRGATGRVRFDIGGKTGTLLDPQERDVLYTWFSGLMDTEKTGAYAIGTLSASPQNWVTRASSLAQKTFAGVLKVGRVELPDVGLSDVKFFEE